MFFDAYPRFYETSRTSAFRGRLNLRYEAIFAENEDVFSGASVLDIASHDGRWSLAALKTGATKVVGIEADEALHDAACENLQEYANDEGSYSLIAGDVFEVLERKSIEADVVLCLGFLYHTIRYTELLRGIRDVGPRYLIVDTQVIPRANQPRVFITREGADKEANAKRDRFSYGEKIIVGVPSIPALELLLDTYDFEIERYSDWASLIRDNPTLDPGGYANGSRVTVRCASRA